MTMASPARRRKTSMRPPSDRFPRAEAARSLPVERTARHRIVQIDHDRSVQIHLHGMLRRHKQAQAQDVVSNAGSGHPAAEARAFLFLEAQPEAGIVTRTGKATKQMLSRSRLWR